MSSEINFSDLWRQQSAVAPSIDELLKSAKKLKTKERLKLIGMMVLMISTGFFIVLIKTNFKTEMATTMLGVVLMLVAMAMLVVSSFGTFGLLMHDTSGISLSEQLEQLIRLKRKQEFMHRVIMSLYFVLLSAGVFLYMIEYTLKMDYLMAVIAYTLTAAWIAFNWFYIRPRTIRKKQTALNVLIEEFERMQQEVKETK